MVVRRPRFSQDYPKQGCYAVTAKSHYKWLSLKYDMGVWGKIEKVGKETTTGTRCSGAGGRFYKGKLTMRRFDTETTITGNWDDFIWFLDYTQEYEDAAALRTNECEKSAKKAWVKHHVPVSMNNETKRMVVRRPKTSRDYPQQGCYAITAKSEYKLSPFSKLVGPDLLYYNMGVWGKIEKVDKVKKELTMKYLPGSKYDPTVTGKWDDFIWFLDSDTARTSQQRKSRDGATSKTNGR